MATTTAQDIITKALGLLVIGAEGEPLTTQQLSDGLDSLNNFLSLLGARSLLTTAQVQESFPLVGGTASYTIGLSAIAPNFTTTMPLQVMSGFIRDQNNNDTGLDVISREEYNAYPLKTDSGLPSKVFYDPGLTQQATPLGTLSFWLTPDTTMTYTAFLVSEKTFTQFASLSGLITFPDYYKHMLIYNMAPILAPFYGASIHPEVEYQAKESLRILETLNSSNKRTVADLGLPKQSRGNILTGQ